MDFCALIFVVYLAIGAAAGKPEKEIFKQKNGQVVRYWGLDPAEYRVRFTEKNRFICFCISLGALNLSHGFQFQLHENLSLGHFVNSERIQISHGFLVSHSSQ